MTSVVDRAGAEHQLNKQMLETTAAFYQESYMACPKNPPGIQDCLQELAWVFQENEGQKLEEWMLEEITKTLYSFKNGKTPRADGRLKELILCSLLGPRRSRPARGI